MATNEPTWISTTLLPTLIRCMYLACAYGNTHTHIKMRQLGHHTRKNILGALMASITHTQTQTQTHTHKRAHTKSHCICHKI